MTEDAVRLATAGDNPALLELERSCPQGTRLLIHPERSDYFFRSALYGNHHTLVAVDRAQERLFGVMATTLKEVLIDGLARPAAFFYDLRVHPDYRRTLLGRHMLRVWNEMERWAEQAGAHLIYGWVKEDNEMMLALQRKRSGWRFSGKMSVVGRPVVRRLPVAGLPEQADPSADGRDLAARLLAAYGRRQLFPAVFREDWLSPEMERTGLFSCWTLRERDSFASLGLFRINRIVGTRVIRLTPAYRLLRPLLEVARRVAPVPRIPRPGERITYCHVFNHLAEGPRGLELWRELLAHANNLAFAEGAALLTSAFDAGDPLLPRFARGAINRIDYLLGFRPLRPDLPESLSPFYPDVRDMD